MKCNLRVNGLILLFSKWNRINMYANIPKRCNGFFIHRQPFLSYGVIRYIDTQISGRVGCLQVTFSDWLGHNQDLFTPK